MRVLLLGASGRLGSCFLEVPGGLSFAPAASRRPLGAGWLALDRLDREGILGLLRAAKPDLVVNCVAVTSRASCSRDPSAAWRVNSLFPRMLAEVCGDSGTGLIHLSTDLVYSGGNAPYSERSPAVPRSLYGWSKLVGDRLLQAASESALIARTSVIFGSTGSARSTFSEELLESSEGTFPVYSDSLRHHTPAHWLAGAVLEAFEMGASGMLLLASGKACSRERFARALFGHLGLDPARLAPCRSPKGTPLDLSLDLRLGRAVLKRPFPDLPSSLGMEYPLRA
ncbi:sugar nucleotide-binding protein [Candidatus Fermentibacterales bacterium]|nr:sugar nucleotide-binding protein [Candidatus Fermentibacterales bacterium]